MSLMNPAGEDVGPRRMTHANFFVENMERAMDFYKDVIGIGESYRRVKSRGGFLTNGSSHHDLGVMEYSERLGGKRAKKFIGFYHVAFEMESDWHLHEWYRNAVERKANFFFLGDHGNTHSVYMFDPDGNQVEVYTDTLKEWWKLKTGFMPTIQSAWKPEGGTPTREPKYHLQPQLSFPAHGYFKPKFTTRATIVLSKFEEGVAFYRDIVGLSPVAGGIDKAFVAFAGTTGKICLLLWSVSESRPPGFHHFSMEMSSDADLREATARFVAGSTVGIKREIDHPARHVLYIEDLDGFELQLYADRDGHPVDLDALDADTAFLLG